MSEIKRDGNQVTVITNARIDTINAGEFERELNPIIAEPGINLTIDCNPLDYIRSSGLRVVLKAQKAVSANKGTMVLKGVKPAIKKVFDMTGFSRFLKME